MSTSHQLSGKAKPVSPGERQGMIAEAAYYLSERRGFTGNDEDQINDWLDAEQQIDAVLAGCLICDATVPYRDT